ncbi:uncharacterized protein LOC117373108 [Periophthalmus magnuspinnatus]|uniref:uncharacterized protein LOC117373108 n=1 Tax=Periophthalmus magnuspinnatus TaxID=409849 RepID=UPI002436CFC0|nr:uncharacterized protein LOC117373108 [Periophthalmus magnuspinnatus]
MAAHTRTIVLLIIQLQFLESDQVHYKCVAEGEDATLPCEKLRPEQKQCDLTTWSFQHTEVVVYGLLNSNRVNLTDRCSLQIKDVQTQDAGEYKCRQHDRSGQSFPLDNLVSLSIVSMSEVTHTSETELICSVSTKQRCVRVPLKWSVGGASVKDYPNLKVETSNCRTSVKFRQQDFKQQKFTCEVECVNNKIQFHFQKDESESTTQKENRENDSDESGDLVDDRSDNGRKGWWWAVIAVAVVLSITAVAFVTWRRVKVNPQESSDTPPAEEEVSYAFINFNTSHKKTIVRVSEEAVTYSSVRIPPKDRAQLYTSVHKQTDK